MNPGQRIDSFIEQHTGITLKCWQFSGESIIRVQEAIRLQRDLGINLPGTALALELLDEVKALRQQVSSLQRDSLL